MKFLWAVVLLFVVMACPDTQSPTSPTTTTTAPPTAVQLPQNDGPAALKECEVLNVRQRRGIPGTNRVVLEVIPAEGVSRIIAKFFIRKGGVLTLSHTEVDIPTSTRIEIELPIECREDEYDIVIWVEATYRGRLIQCDGSVTLNFKCEPGCLDCDCIDCVDDPECELPPIHNFSVPKPLGNPRSECSYFGNFTPGSPGDFYITKCGLFYELTHTPWTWPKCSNGKDVSHSTGCVCLESE